MINLLNLSKFLLISTFLVILNCSLSVANDPVDIWKQKEDKTEKKNNEEKESIESSMCEQVHEEA